MSKFDSDDLDTVGYFLPQHSQLRLKKLHDHVDFLSRLLSPLTADEARERVTGIRVGEVAIGLEWLAEQLGRVLDELGWPASRRERELAPGVDAEPASVEAVPDDADGNYLFGMTLAQLDTLNQLIGMIAAHGDVVTASDHAELADHTLSLLGQLIFDDARAVREIIRQVGAQRLGPAHGAQSGVGEERAAYHAGCCRSSRIAKLFELPRPCAVVGRHGRRAARRMPPAQWCRAAVR